MPLDPSISLQVQPLANPLTQYANALDVQSAMQKNALLPLQMQQMQLQNARAQQQFNMISPILTKMASGQSNGAQQSDAGGVPASGGTLDANGNMTPTNAQGTGQSSQSPSSGNAANNPQGVPTDDGIPYSLNDIAALAAAGYPGAKEMLDAKKAAMAGVKFDPGSTYNVGGKVFTVPMLDKGMQLGPDGTVSAIPGYSNTNAGIQGQQSAAVEGAKLLPLGYVSPDGTPIGGSVGHYLGESQNGQQTASQQPTPGQPQQSNTGSYQVPTVGSDGQPLTPQFQHILSSVASSRDPKTLNNFTNLVSSHLDQMPDGPQKQAGYAALADQVGKIWDSWQEPQQGQKTQQVPQPQQQANGTPQLQSATQAAQLAANLKLQTDPAIKAATDVAGGDAANFTAYNADLNKNVDSGYAQFQRNQQVRQLLNEYQTGLGSPELRSAFASNLQNAFPGNQTAKAFAEKINGGNVGSGQELANLLSSAGLTNVIRTLDGNGRVNKAEYAALQEHAETNRSDPSALLGIMGYQDNVYNQQRAEQQALAQSRTNGTFNPATWNATYANIRQNNLMNSPLPATPGQMASGAQPQAQQQAQPQHQQPSGGTMRVSNAADYSRVPSGSTYMAPDGTIRRKP